MNLSSAVVLLTGATGGIGRAIAKQLLERGARLLLTGRDIEKLNGTREAFGASTDCVDVVAADLTQEADRRHLRARAASWQGGINVLINNAGVSEFRRVEQQSSEQLEALVAVNLIAPMQLTRELLTHLRRQSFTHVLNVGSVYGAIGYPGYAVYSATKFGLRGFTEALRRELADTSVRVHYLAPRATRTSMNSAAADSLNAHLRVKVDSAERVARAVCRMLEREERDRAIGWPENLFIRVNALLPRVIDNAVRKQLPSIHRYAEADRASAVAADDQPHIARTSL